MNRYPAWLNILVIFILALGTLFALPNLYGEDPALQMSREDRGDVITDRDVNVATGLLDQQDVAYNAAYIENGRLLLRFPDVDDQIAAQTALDEYFDDSYLTALTPAPRTPDWMRNLGLKPMSLGLDLRGGVHFLFEVDLDGAVRQMLETLEDGFSREMREPDDAADKINYTSIAVVGDAIEITLRDDTDVSRLYTMIRNSEPRIDLSNRQINGQTVVTARPNAAMIRERQDFAIEQNIVTLRNRVNELGVAEPLVQRQGLNRIVVQLPGMQDPNQAKEVLSATATVEFRLVDQDNNALDAHQRGRAPLGTILDYDRNDQPVLLKRDLIASGDQLTGAVSTFSEGQPVVDVTLNGQAARRMKETTLRNVGKPMAVLFIEQKCRELGTREQGCLRSEKVTEVISVATIQGVFGSRFQISGLSTFEAQELALLLRAGSLAAPIFIVEERTIGPSLGRANVEQGQTAVMVGFLLVVAFMLIYYRVFGVIANLALLANLVLLIAALSLLQAVLTLPGIAGIVLTVGMAVDANVLIFERIREEIRNGNSPQASITAGYGKAFSSIVDANVTTLIAAIVLFTFGTGAIRGFAITLFLGILTSMFTAIIGTRALVNVIYGSRQRLSKLAI